MFSFHLINFGGFFLCACVRKEVVILAANYFGGNNALECTSKQWFYNTLQALQVVIFRTKSEVVWRKIWGKSFWIRVFWQSFANWLWSRAACYCNHPGLGTWAVTSAQHCTVHAPVFGEAQRIIKRCSTTALVAFHTAIAMIPDGPLGMLRQPDSNRGWDLVVYLPYQVWAPVGHFRHPAAAVTSAQDWQI